MNKNLLTKRNLIGTLIILFLISVILFWLADRYSMNIILYSFIIVISLGLCIYGSMRVYIKFGIPFLEPYMNRYPRIMSFVLGVLPLILGSFYLLFSYHMDVLLVRYFVKSIGVLLFFMGSLLFIMWWDMDFYGEKKIIRESLEKGNSSTIKKLQYSISDTNSIGFIESLHSRFLGIKFNCVLKNNENVLEALILLSANQIKGTEDSALKLIQLKEISKDKRLIWMGSADALYRFLIFLFNLNCEYQARRSYIADFIFYYFLGKNNTELRVNEDKFSKQRNCERLLLEGEIERVPNIYIQSRKYFNQTLNSVST